jgi:hypothetical protein
VGADKAALLKEHQRFVVPTLDELAQNGERIGLTQNEVEKFQSHYESNGWRVGKNKMKNWRAAMSGWKTRVDEYNAKRTNDTRPNGHINSRNAQMGDGQRLNSERSAAESKAIDDAYTLDGRIPMS